MGCGPVAGATLVAQAMTSGPNVALYGVFPATYDCVLDLINYLLEDEWFRNNRFSPTAVI